MLRVATLILLWFVLVSSVAAKDKAAKEGTFYKLGELGIKEKKVEGGKLKVTFKPRDEQFYWCPGIKIEKTKKATVVTFVRCKTSKSCSIDQPAKIGKRLIRNVEFNTNGLDVYVRNGASNFRRIYQSPNSKLAGLPDELTSEDSKSGTGPEVNTKTKPTSGSGKRPLILVPSNR